MICVKCKYDVQVNRAPDRRPHVLDCLGEFKSHPLGYTYDVVQPIKGLGFTTAAVQGPKTKAALIPAVASY